jgi:hypothetical protein
MRAPASVQNQLRRQLPHARVSHPSLAGAISTATTGAWLRCAAFPATRSARRRHSTTTATLKQASRAPASSSAVWVLNPAKQFQKDVNSAEPQNLATLCTLSINTLKQIQALSATESQKLRHQLLASFITAVGKRVGPAVALTALRLSWGLAAPKAVILSPEIVETLTKWQSSLNEIIGPEAVQPGDLPPISGELSPAMSSAFFHHSALQAVLQQLASAPRCVNGAKPSDGGLVSDVAASQAATLVRQYTKASEKRLLLASKDHTWTACAPPRGVFHELLRVFAVHGIPKSHQTLQWGYRKTVLPGSGADHSYSSVYTSVFPLDAPSAHGKRSRLAPIPSAVAHATQLSLGRTSSPDADTSSEVISEHAHAWQARGGLWLQKRHNPVAPVLGWRQYKARDSPVSGAEAEMDGSLVGTSPVTAPIVRTHPTADTVVNPSSHLARLQRAIESTTVPQPFSTFPRDYHPAVDILPHKANISPALRLAMSIWREMTGRLILTNGVSPPSSRESESFPCAETARHLLQLAANVDDVTQIMAMCEADGVWLTGPMLSVGVQQCVRFGRIEVGLWILEKATDQLKREKFPSKNAATSSTGTPLPKPPSRQHDGLRAAIGDAFDALLQAAAKDSANIQATSIFAAALKENVTPSWASVSTVLRSAVICGFSMDSMHIASSVLNSGKVPTTMAVPKSTPLPRDVTPFESLSTIERSLQEFRASGPIPASTEAHVLGTASWSKALGYPEATQCAAVRALGQIGDIAGVLTAWEQSARLASTHKLRFPAELSRSFVSAFSTCAHFESAIAAIHASAVMGSPIRDNVVTPLLHNISTLQEVQFAFRALHMLQAAGVAPTERIIADLVSMASVVARNVNKPIPTALAKAIQGTPSPLKVKQLNPLGTADEANALQPLADAEEEKFAKALATTGTTTLEKYSVFTNTEVGKAVKAQLRARLYPDSPVLNPLESALEAARGLVSAIARWTVQHVSANAGGARGAAVFSTGDAVKETADALALDDDMEAALDMMIVAIGEWPISTVLHDAAYELNKKDVPACAAAQRRDLLLRALRAVRNSEQLPSSPSYVVRMRELASHSAFVESLDEPSIRPVVSPSGQTSQTPQYLPPSVYGPAKHFLHWNLCEDGTGFAGPKPVFGRYNGSTKYFDFHTDAPLTSPGLSVFDPKRKVSVVSSPQEMGLSSWSQPLAPLLAGDSNDISDEIPSVTRQQVAQAAQSETTTLRKSVANLMRAFSRPQQPDATPVATPPIATTGAAAKPQWDVVIKLVQQLQPKQPEELK